MLKEYTIDMVLLSDLPEEMLKSAELYAGCIAGALKKNDYLDKIRKAGFENIEILKEDSVQLLEYIGSDKILNDIIKNMTQDEIDKINNIVVSLKISAWIFRICGVMYVTFDYAVLCGIIDMLLAALSGGIL